MKERFKGRLRAKNPNDLIRPEGKDDLGDFFLALALIFNDMKGITTFQSLLNERFEPVDGAVSHHNGEFGGQNIQIIRIFSGLIAEFLIFLQKSPIVDSEQFQELLNQLPIAGKELWQHLIAISKMESVPENPTNYALMRIRGNITYHYYDAGKNLRPGFVEKFYNKPKSKQNKNEGAYYSLEESMESTRFYYADAAAEEYMKHVSDGWDDYINDMNGLVETMNHGIFWLMKVYLKSKKDQGL